MNLRRALASTALTAVALIAGATGASGSEYPDPSKADQSAARKANRVCKDVEVDRQWAQCFTGAFQMTRTDIRYQGRKHTNLSANVVIEDGILWDGGTVVLVDASRTVDLTTPGKVTKRDRKAMRKANAECLDLPRTDVTWEACTIGAFAWHRDRVISDNDYRIVKAKGTYVLRLTHGSHKIG